MRRHGPISAGERPGLFVGDRGGRHLVLYRDRIEHVGDHDTEAWAWDDLAGVTLAVPATRWPFPVIPDIVLPFVLAIIAPGMDTTEPRDLHLTVHTTSGEGFSRALSAHWASGYPRAQAGAAQRLVTLLHTSRPTRELLDRPSDIVHRIGRITR